MDSKEGEEVLTPSITTTTKAGEPEAAQTMDSSKEGEEGKKTDGEEGKKADGETEAPVRKPNPRLRLGTNPGAIIKIRR